MPFELPYPLQFHGIISTIGPMDILDIFIVAVILYKVYVARDHARQGHPRALRRDDGL